jgi:hypothetical protein
MWNNLVRLLTDPSGFTPHGFCLLWDPTLIWTYAASDIGIGIAYFTIPLALAIFVHSSPPGTAHNNPGAGQDRPGHRSIHHRTGWHDCAGG